ncbi:MAG: 1-(5-phosphoribosyl)-5-[(5-phosphoribosylamino)methylideneamino]imidazole-4-carboxamide isomerase [Clostridiaceae bacterium]
MIIFPAVDIKNGKCVRLQKGAWDSATIYNDEPFMAAKLWAAKGAEFIHIVNLDGAFGLSGDNMAAIKKIIDNVSVPVQLGGGIRSMSDITDALRLGINRVILGTAAINDREFLKEAINKYNEKIVVSIDAKDGYAAVKGWTEVTPFKVLDLSKEFEEYGLKTLVYTDISRDGMMMGPDFKTLMELNEKTNLDIIASGGIKDTEDILKLKEAELYGAIIGKALYTGDIILEEILC